MIVNSQHRLPKSNRTSASLGILQSATSSVSNHPSGVLSCAKAQKHLSASPLFATLTDSLSRKSFPCHSYENTRGECIPPPKFFALGLQLSAVDCELSFSLTMFRINTYISVASKRLHLPLESTLTKKQGEGGGVLLTSCQSNFVRHSSLAARHFVILKPADGSGDRWLRVIGAGGKSGHRRRRLARAGDEVGQRAW